MSDDRGQSVTTKELQKILGLSRTQIMDLINDGMPYKEKGARGKPYIFNTYDVRIWRESRSRANDPRRKAEKPEQPAGPSAKDRVNQAAAELKEIELKRARGELIAVADIGPIVDEEMAQLRAALLDIPNQLARKFNASICAEADKLIRAALETFCVDPTKAIEQ